MNEMTSPVWGSPFSLAPGSTEGQAALAAFTFETDPQWIWAGVGFLILNELVFIGLGALVLKVSGRGRAGRGVLQVFVGVGLGVGTTGEGGGGHTGREVRLRSCREGEGGS